MATVVSDFGPDIARFSRNMVVGEAHQKSLQLPNTPSTQARIPSTISSTIPTPPNSQKTPTARSRAISQSKLSKKPIIESSIQKDTPRTLPSAEQEQREIPANGGEPFQNGPSEQGDQNAHVSAPPSPRLQPTQRSMLSFTGSGSSSPNRIKVRDLSHIHRFASEEVLTKSRQGSSHSLKSQRALGQQYEISAMPVADIIEMVAGLLTKITTTNDQQHEHIHRHIPPPEGTAGLSQQAASVLAFHGKNAPSITILSYLSRINKYCPTSYEIFISLLVYFDRMTEMVNSGSLTIFGDQSTKNGAGARRNNPSAGSAKLNTTPPSPAQSEPRGHGIANPGNAATNDDSRQAEDAYNLSQIFVVDSYNIHRLTIAAVTSASKFFSDIFYTNSRYAKVGFFKPWLWYIQGIDGFLGRGPTIDGTESAGA